MGGLRIGLNIHNRARGGQDRSAEEKSYLPQFLKQLNPSALVIMDDLPLAEAMYSALPNTITIYRQYNPAEGHLWQVISPEQYFINQKGISKPGMPLYIINEADSKAPVEELAARAKWIAREMDLRANAGLLGVYDNAGPGHPILEWFTDDTKWQAVKPMFDAFKRHPQMYWSLHPYWGPNGLRPQDGQSARHRDIEKHLKAKGYTMPNLIFTETGIDNHGGGKTNGWRTTGISEEQYAAQIIEARNTLWTEPYIRGVCLFSYGASTDRWLAFDVESAKVLHTALIGANAISIPTPKPPDPVPVPTPPTPAEKTLTKVSACRDAIAIHNAAILALEAEIDALLEPYKTAA